MRSLSFLSPALRGGRAFAALILLLCMLLSLGACAGEEPQTAEPVSATEPADPPAEPGHSFTDLTPPARFSAGTQVGAVGPDALLFCAPAEDGSDATRLAVWAIGEDSFRTELLLPGTVTLIGASSSSGRFAVRNGEDRCTVYDGSLREIASMTLPSGYGGGVAADSLVSMLYYSEYGTLCAFSAETGERTVVPAANLTVTSVSGPDRDADGEYLVLTVYASPFTEETAEVRFRPEDGSVLRASRNEPGFPGHPLTRLAYASGSRFGLLKTYGPPVGDPESPENVRTASFSLVGWDGDTLRYWTPEDDSDYPDGVGGSLTALSEDSLVLSYAWDAGEELRFIRFDLTRFFPTVPYRPEEDAASAAAETEATLNAISLAFELPKTSSLRGIADTLEERYGILIYVGEECASYRDADQFTMSLTSDGRTAEEEREKIDRALEALDSVLSLFPEGFFRQFRSETGPGGLRIFLSGPLFANGISASALTDAHGACCNVVLSIDTSSILTIIAHELWHTMEYFCFIRGLLPEEESWAELNPPDFAYAAEYEGYTEDDGRYSYPTETDPDEIWFVTKYGKVNANEDRARIFEKLLADESVAQKILQSPHIRAKLDRMCEAVRAAFDDTGWESVPWERTGETPPEA